jgi:hypothetical protein
MAALTVYFDDPFWVGVFEQETAGGLAIARVVFGPEPSDAQVHAAVRELWRGLAWRTASVGEAPPRRPRSPKRAQREAARAAAAPAPSTRAQEAMRLVREAQKRERQVRSREEKEREAERRYRLRREKQKRRHRGR